MGLFALQLMLSGHQIPIERIHHIEIRLECRLSVEEIARHLHVTFLWVTGHTYLRGYQECL